MSWARTFKSSVDGLGGSSELSLLNSGIVMNAVTPEPESGLPCNSIIAGNLIGIGDQTVVTEDPGGCVTVVVTPTELNVSSAKVVLAWSIASWSTVGIWALGYFACVFSLGTKSIRLVKQLGETHGSLLSVANPSDGSGILVEVSELFLGRCWVAIAGYSTAELVKVSKVAITAAATIVSFAAVVFESGNSPAIDTPTPSLLHATILVTADNTPITGLTTSPPAILADG